MKAKNVAVVGVGAVGIEMIRCLKNRKFPLKSLKLLARSARTISLDGQQYQVEAITPESFQGVDIALFAGTEGEKGAAVTYAEIAVKNGAVVIDNGSDFRLREDVPLVVPEVNADTIANHKGIIANPNCTTIQALVALGPIHKKFGLEKIVLTSFQAVSGAGKNAMIGLWEETKNLVEKNKDKDVDNLDRVIDGKPKGFDYQIALNVIPQIGGFAEAKYTSEEWKVVYETHKILGDNTIRISATCVRVPVLSAHSEAIYFATKKKASIPELEKALKAAKGLTYLADGLALPLDIQGKDDVYVARLRKDLFEKNSFWLWCVGDNLLKGAALNAVQIAECL